MDKVCIALDYNPNAEKVAQAGVSLAKAMGAELHLVHVVADAGYYSMDYDPFMGMDGTYQMENIAIYQQVVNAAENFLKKSKEHLAYDNVKTKVLDGLVEDALLEYCDNEHINVLVMGTHSHTALENALLGNVAAKVVRHTKIPVLVVPIQE